MARPEKSGIDYYPRDIGLCRDRKFRRLRLKYGYVAVAVYESLLDMIYADKGYYLPYGPEEQADVIWEIMTDLQGVGQPSDTTVLRIIDDLAACGLLDQHMLDTRQILTSRRIQETYYKATIERKNVTVDPSVWMLSVDEMKALSTRGSIVRFFENQPINPVNQPTNEVNQPISTQRKGKEKKEKESKENRPGEAQSGASPARQDQIPEKIFIEFPLNDGSLWPVTESMMKYYAQLYQAVDVPAEIRKMRGWLDAHPKNRKTRSGISSYVARWLSKAQDQAARVPAQSPPAASRMEVIT